MMVFTIAPVFICVVAGIIIFSVVTGLLRHRRLFDQVSDEIERTARERGRGHRDVEDEWKDEEPESGDYSCQNCGAGLGADTEISPSGDFKCRYCKTWNNVHQ